MALGVINASIDYKSSGLQKNRSTNEGDLNKTGSTAKNSIRAAGTVTKATGASLQTTGTALKVAGTGIKVVGSGVSVAGAGISAAGMAASTTVIGSVVGVPLIVAGRVVGLAGTGIKATGSATKLAGRVAKAAGKTVSKTGGAMSRTGRSFPRRSVLMRFASNASSVALDVALKIRVSLLNISIVSWGMTLWMVQLIFALASNVFLGLLGGSSAIVSSSFVTRWAGWVLNKAVEGATWLISGSAISISDMTSGMFLVMYVIVLSIGLVTIMAANMQYMMSSIHSLSGEGLGAKYVALLIVIMGYSTPLLNLFPWFLVFLAVVWKYPK